MQTIGIDENSLNPTSFDFYSQGNGGFGNQPEDDDEFGYAVQLRWGSACRASNQCWTVKHMAVGVPGENNNRGLLQISHDELLNVHQNHLNNASRNVGDRFGNAIAVSLNWRDYLVGVPNEDLNDHSNAGVAHYIEINSKGEIEDNRLLVQ